MVLIGFEMIAEEEYLLIIQPEGLLPGFGLEVVVRQRTQNEFIGRSGEPASNPMTIPADVLPNIECSIHQWMGLYGVHLGIGQPDVASHLTQNRSMSGANLIVH